MEKDKFDIEKIRAEMERKHRRELKKAFLMWLAFSALALSAARLFLFQY